MAEYRRPTTSAQYISLADKLRMEHERQKSRLRYVSQTHLTKQTGTPYTLHLTQTEMNMAAQALRAVLAIAEYDRCDPELFAQMFPDFFQFFDCIDPERVMTASEYKLRCYEILARAVTNGIL